MVNARAHAGGPRVARRADPRGVAHLLRAAGGRARGAAARLGARPVPGVERVPGERRQVTAARGPRALAFAPGVRRYG